MHSISVSTILCAVTMLILPARSAQAQIYRVKEMTTDQIRSLEKEKTVVLLPGGILEEHGPYLPSFADGYMNKRLTQSLAEAIVVRPGWKVLIFPVIPLGTDGANYIGGKHVFPGSYTVRSATLRAVFMDLATALGEQGFRWIFVLSIHGAPTHHRALNQACDYFNDTYGGVMIHLGGLMKVDEAWDIGRQRMSRVALKEEGLGVHADMRETSVNLFLRPDLVSPEYRSASPYTGEVMDDLVDIAEGKGWPGYFGSPRWASAAYGAELWGVITSRWVEVALAILDGRDYRQMERWGDVARTNSAFVAIDKEAQGYEEAIQQKQLKWLEQQERKNP